MVHISRVASCHLMPSVVERARRWRHMARQLGGRRASGRVPMAVLAQAIRHRGGTEMMKSGGLVGLCIAVAVGAGGVAESQMLDTRQSAAVQTALERGRFDLNCPSATATVLSRDYIQPAIQGPWVAGLQRVEYTVGVEGCNQRTTFVVMCQIGTSTCFAANPRDRFQQR